MKAKQITSLFFLLVFALSACTGAATPAATEESASSIAPTSTPEVQPTPEPSPIVYEPATVTINKSSLTSFAPIFIAEAEGYFEEYGIVLNYVEIRGNQAMPLIISGDLDVLASSVNAGVLNILSQEEGIKVVADRGSTTAADTCAYVGLLVRTDLVESGAITGPEDLQGQTIVATDSGPTGYFLSNYLAQAGLTFADITLSDLPTTGYPDALANGSIAAIVAPELHLTRNTSSGNAVLLTSSNEIVGPIQQSVMLFGNRLLVENRDVGARFLAAYLKGVQQYNEGKTERNIQIIAEATGESPDLIEASCWIPVRVDGSIDFAGIEGFQQWSIEQGHLDAAVTEEQFWDSSLLEEARKLIAR